MKMYVRMNYATGKVQSEQRIISSQHKKKQRGGPAQKNCRSNSSFSSSIIYLPQRCQHSGQLTLSNEWRHFSSFVSFWVKPFSHLIGHYELSFALLLKVHWYTWMQMLIDLPAGCQVHALEAAAFGFKMIQINKHIMCAIVSSITTATRSGFFLLIHPIIAVPDKQ